MKTDCVSERPPTSIHLSRRVLRFRRLLLRLHPRQPSPILCESIRAQAKPLSIQRAPADSKGPTRERHEISEQHTKALHESREQRHCHAQPSSTRLGRLSRNGQAHRSCAQPAPPTAAATATRTWRCNAATAPPPRRWHCCLRCRCCCCPHCRRSVGPAAVRHMHIRNTEQCSCHDGSRGSETGQARDFSQLSDPARAAAHRQWPASTQAQGRPGQRTTESASAHKKR